MSASGLMRAVAGAESEAQWKAILDDARQRAQDKAADLIRARAKIWNLDLSAEQVDTLARAVAWVVREQTANVVFAAFQLGIDRDVARTTHDEPTAPGGERCGHCGR